MVAEQRITSLYRPRSELHASIHRAIEDHRFGAVVCHRRFGKTVLALNHLQIACLECQRERPRFAFIAPTYTQAKSIAWDYLVHYSSNLPSVTARVSELTITYPHGGQVRLFGADNPDSLRGLYFDGVVFDEYGLQPPRIFTEVVRPALSDRQGWAWFLGTPAGKNQFYDVIQQAQRESGWFYACHKASETGIIDERELAAAARDMTSDEYAQEYECSFEASVKGAIYASEIADARAGGRVSNVPIDPVLPVDTDWDLGVGDSTAIWFSQSTRGGEVRVIDYYEASGEGLPHYKQVLQAKGYTYGQHWAPFDIEVRELGSGRTRLETAASLGIKFQIAPNVPLEDGIHAARMLLPRCWFDAAKCEKGLEALQHYRRDYNTRLNEFKAVPVHDWACFTQDTEVLTRSGTCAIMDLPENGEVLTPCGWKQYRGPRITQKSARLVAVTLSDGSTVRCTPDHLWLTDDGWTSAESLQGTTPIQSCSIHSFNISTGSSIDSGHVSGISHAVVRDFIETCGPRRLGQFLTDAISITGMSTQTTTGLTTWNVSLPATTCESYIVRNRGYQRLREPVPLYGIVPPLDDSGTVGWPSAPKAGPNGVGKIGPALTAAWWSICSSVRAVINRSIARKPVRRLRIVSVTTLTEIEDVCCIHVPGVECFTLANGAIVHNSHGADAFRYLAVRQQPPKAKPVEDPYYYPQPSETAWMQ